MILLILVSLLAYFAVQAIRHRDVVDIIFAILFLILVIMQVADVNLKVG